MKLDLTTLWPATLTTALGLGLLLAACGCVDLESQRAPRDSAPPVGGVEAGDDQAGEVVINGRTLSPGELASFRQRYGVEPVSGKYWYDSLNGMWGMEGAPASGFIFPGHDFGRLASNASNGRSGIFLNGRQMDFTEVAMFQSMLGAQIWPGRYWLDGYGNYGYEGFALATGNLYQVMAARGNGGRGSGGGGGDNYWSSRYASGNSNADNSAGYVYIPGTGSVSYGL